MHFICFDFSKAIKYTFYTYFKENISNTCHVSYLLKFSILPICKLWASEGKEPWIVHLCPWVQASAQHAERVLRGREREILFSSLGWFSLAEIIRVKLSLSHSLSLLFPLSPPDLPFLYVVAYWFTNLKIYGGQNVDFSFLKNVKLRDKTYSCAYLERDVQSPCILPRKFHCINGLLLVDGKIKLTGIPSSPIVPVNWGISVLFKLSELLN